MLISPAYAQDAAGILGSATQFMPLILIFAVFYFLLIRPQQQRQKEMKRMLAALKRGDRVVTGGGIIGVVQKVGMTSGKDGKPVESNEIDVEIAPNTRVTVLRETIASVITQSDAKPANDSKPAKAS
ncbi:MAG: preprotein translocase subunit YajC [Proteobacteria bacterium]|nr:preprotein translocase subunit YajC [Pseudomonadota bacterium]